MKRKRAPEPMTTDGFTKMSVTLNLSLACWKCKNKPYEFYWKSRPGKLTEIYCLGCKTK